MEERDRFIRDHVSRTVASFPFQYSNGGLDEEIKRAAQLWDELEEARRRNWSKAR